MISREQEEQIARLLAGEELDAEGMRALLAALEQDAQAGDSAADQVLLDRLLRHRFHYSRGDGFSREVLARLAPAATPLAPLRVRVVRHLTRQRWRRAAAAAAAFLLAGGIWLLKAPTQHAAQITSSISARWPGGGILANGTQLETGARVKPDSGFVSIHFSHGAEVLLEGAADLEITGPDSATLHQGNAVTRVPEEARGFVMQGPRGRVVEPGGGFAMRVSDGQMEVHVLGGNVATRPDGQDAIALKQNGGLRLREGGTDPITAMPQHFLTALPPVRLASAPWLHWSMDEGAGSTVTARGAGFSLTDAKGTLRSLPGATVLPDWTTGVRGSGVELHGRNDYIQTNLAGIPGSSPRTVACWVKVPQDISGYESFALVSWGAHEIPGDTWQISINPHPEDGPVGRLRVGTHFGQVVGTRDLRDGLWHHVAAVLYEGLPANVATHVLLYVDGELEPAACKSVRSINTNTTGQAAQRVAFGKNTAIRDSRDRPHLPHTFRGCLDEITLYGCALSAEDIRHLMKNGAGAIE